MGAAEHIMYGAGAVVVVGEAVVFLHILVVLAGVNLVARSTVHFVRFTFHPSGRAFHLFAPFIYQTYIVHLFHLNVGEATVARCHD